MNLIKANIQEMEQNGVQFIRAHQESHFLIGKDVHIQRGVWLDTSGGITLEDNVEIALGTIIYTHKHPVKFQNWRKMNPTFTPLIIREDAYIGSNVILIAINEIGKGAVIGAGSIVTHNVPPYEIWAGNPAKKIGVSE